jgi:hypothetical protein
MIDQACPKCGYRNKEYPSMKFNPEGYYICIECLYCECSMCLEINNEIKHTRYSK